MTQFYSRNDVNYSGDVYSIPFDYIDKKEVKVYIDDELWTEWHFLNKHQLTLDEVPAEIGYNNIISVRRETDIAEKVVTYDNNSLLNKENLNKSQDQLLFAVQEIYDNNVQFQSDIREEVDEKVERVSDAVEKLEFLEDSVEIANEAALEATEQAQIATEKTQEVLQTYETAMSDINNLVADHTDDLNALDQLIKKDADAIINRVGFNMFDTVIKDHILTYEESKGLALQGTWVYKEAIAGERYGYADFYNKCLEEYQNSEVYTEEWTQPVATGATTTIDGGNMVITVSSSAGTNWSGYKAFDNISSSGSNGWAVSDADVAGWWQVKFPYKIKITGLKYYRRYSTAADNATIGRFYTSSDKAISIGDEFSVSAGANAQYYLDIVNIPMNGIITDTIYLETQAVNGSYGGMDYLEITAEKVGIAQLYKNANGHIFYNIADKDNIDEVFATTGMAWMYGIDQENERIFLPRNVWFEQMSMDDVGKAIEAGLPNITGGFKVVGNTDPWVSNVTSDRTGAFYNRTEVSGKQYYASVVNNTNSNTHSTGFDASRSNPIYGNSDTVQPNAVKKLLYICVGNTVSDTSWIDVVTQVNGGVKDIEEAKDEAIDAMKNIVGGTVPLGFIGFSALGIDETLNLQRNLNGQIIIQDQFKGFTKFLKKRIELYPSLACTEAEWQTELTMSANGVCDKYVIDDEAGTIRLPKYPDYLDLSINGAKTVSVYGNGKALSVTNGTKTGVFTASSNASANPLIAENGIGQAVGYNTGDGKGWTNHTAIGVNTNASKSGLTGSVTTSSEQIKGTYFIQVATGAETEDNIINEIELNNPFSLLDYKYSEYELNNLSWLRSEGQYNYKAIYPAVYDLLLKIYNGTETKAGVSVKLTSEAFTDYDFVLNTADETFRLPVKVKLASGKAVVGNGMAIGLESAGSYYGLCSADTHILAGRTGAYGIPSGDTTYTGNWNPSGHTFGLTNDPTKSGLELSDSGLYLYFYVGETVQNANLVNIGRIQETYTTKSMVDGRWVSTYVTMFTGTLNANASNTYDLSNYLPNDGFDYEVLFYCQGNTGATSGNSANLLIGTDIIASPVMFIRANTRTSSSMEFANALNLPVGAGRYVTLKQNVNYNCTIIGFGIKGYRRLGTNL